MQKIQMELQELDAQEAGGLVEPRAWYQTMTPPAPEQLEQDSLARQKEWLQHQATPELVFIYRFLVMVMKMMWWELLFLSMNGRFLLSLKALSGRRKSYA